jgi:tetratricopeptide (TPR) repeat protein
VAAQTFRRGRAAAQDLPGHAALREALDGQLRLAERGEAAGRLHALADGLRLTYGTAPGSAPALAALEARCRQEWAWWGAGGAPGGDKLEPDLEEQVRADLLDLLVLWVDLRIRGAPAGEVERARQEALDLLAEAESRLGPSAVVCREQQKHAEALGLTGLAREAARRAADLAPRTAWEHYALARSYLGAGDLGRAAAEFDRAIDLAPRAFWPNFFRGVCSYRLGRYVEAVSAFQACIVLAPRRAECYYNRALAYGQLGDSDRALHDYDRALELDPHLVAALLNRGMLHYHGHRFPEATADLRRALDWGAEPATVYYNLALVDLAQGDRAAARARLELALRHDPLHKEARELHALLRQGR